MNTDLTCTLRIFEGDVVSESEQTSMAEALLALAYKFTADESFGTVWKAECIWQGNRQWSLIID